MQIVIEVDEYKLNSCKRRVEEYYASWYDEAIAKGVVLPKGHGRLIDESDVINKINLNYNNHQLIDAQSIKDIIRTVATTVGADRR